MNFTYSKLPRRSKLIMPNFSVSLCTTCTWVLAPLISEMFAGAGAANTLYSLRVTRCHRIPAKRQSYHTYEGLYRHLFQVVRFDVR